MIKTQGIRKMSRTDVSDPTVKVTIEFMAPPVISIEKLEEIKHEVPSCMQDEINTILSSPNKETVLQTLFENQLNAAFSDIADDIANYIATSFSINNEGFVIAMANFQSFMESSTKNIIISELQKQITIESMR